MNNTEQQPAPASPAEPRLPGEQAPESGPEAAPQDWSPDAQHGPEQLPPPPQGPPPAGWGAPPPPPANRARWSVRRTIIAVAVAVGIAAAGGVAIYAASNSTSGNQVGGPGGVPGGQNGGPGGNFNQRGGGPVMGGPLGDADHGEFQNGEVTAISDSSITAKSDDGYTRTYVIDSDTVVGDGIAKGDDVMIVATTSSDDKATATVVTEQGQGMLPPRRDGQNGSPPTQ